MTVTPTPQQSAIMAEMAHGTENVVGRARAGTGKTKTFELGAEDVPFDQEVIACCFNKTIQRTMAERFPEHWLVKTQHSLGLGTIYKRFRMKPKIEKKKNEKNRSILKQIERSHEFPDIIKAVGICKAWGVVPRGALADPRTLLPDEPDTYFDLFDKYTIDTGYHPDPVGLVRGCLLKGIELAWRQELIDFDDMLYLSVIYDAPYPQADTVLIDEAQDVAPINREQLRLMMKPGSRLIAIGDDRQAIYGFRGADRQSLQKIIEEFNCKILPLTVSFRCSKAVVEHAQEIVPDIEWWDKAPDGEVIPEADEEVERFPRGAAILCRNNAPLISACLKFIKAGRGATILGNDIASGLITLINKQKAHDLPELLKKVWDDVDHRADLLEQRDKSNQASALRDKAECIEHLILHVGKDGTISSLKGLINEMFSDEKGVITLSTIHKAKGLEWPVVYILDEHLMPSKFAKGPEEKLQERNLMYVARTRAQEKLIYITSGSLR